jgi:hypothetical protein
MRLFLVGLVLFLLSAAGTQASETALNEKPFDYTRPWAFRGDGAANVWTAYYSTDGNLYLREGKREPLVMNTEEKKGASAGLALEVDGSQIDLAWREKTTRKELLFRHSADSGKTFEKTMSLGGDTEPLTRIEMGSNKNSVYLAWLGEKRFPVLEGERKEYNIFFSSSRDSGKTFSTPFQVTEGYRLSIYPGLLVDDSGACVFSWSQSLLDQASYLVVRKYDQSLDKWDAPVNIAKTMKVVFFKTFRAKERLFCIWDHFMKREDFVVEGAYSDDRGKTWKGFSFGDTKGLDIGVMDIASDDQGHIYIVYSGKAELSAKNEVFLIRSSDNGTTWEKPLVPRHYPFNNTKAQNPVTIATKGGVVVAWEDWRNIRPSIYMNYSKDYGKTWQEADVPLTEPGKENTTLDPLVRGFLYQDGEFQLAAQRHKSDALIERDLVLIKFKADGVK